MTTNIHALFDPADTLLIDVAEDLREGLSAAGHWPNPVAVHVRAIADRLTCVVETRDEQHRWRVTASLDAARVNDVRSIVTVTDQWGDECRFEEGNHSMAIHELAVAVFEIITSTVEGR